MNEIQIVGAGPVGCIAAKEAAEAGSNVAVFEQREKIGLRLKCSGVISKKGLDSLGVDYRKAVLNRIYGARIHSPSLKRMDVISKKLQAFVIDRKEFDVLCAEEAEDAGAKLKLGRKVRRGELNSKLIIGADGALSDVARWFNFPKINEFAFCYQADFKGVEVDNKGVVDVFLSNESFPGFFGWVIPLNESEVRVGLGAFRDVRKRYDRTVKHYFKKFTETNPVVSELIKNSKGENIVSAIIPLSVRETTAKEKVILVGDAAGQVKATTGGGVVFGGNCARVAGRLAPILIQRGVEEYEAEWRRKFGRDLAMHKKIRGLYNSLSDSQIERYFSFGKRIGVERFLVEHGDMDSPTAMVESADKPAFGVLIRMLGERV